MHKADCMHCFLKNDLDYIMSLRNKKNNAEETDNGDDRDLGRSKIVDVDRVVWDVSDVVQVLHIVQAARVYRPPAMAVRALIMVSKICCNGYNF